MVIFLLNLAVFDFVFIITNKMGEISFLDSPELFIFPLSFLILISALVAFWLKKCDWMDSLIITISAVAGFVFASFIADSLESSALPYGMIGWGFFAVIISLLGFAIGRALRSYFRKSPTFRLLCTWLSKKIH